MPNVNNNKSPQKDFGLNLSSTTDFNPYYFILHLILISFQVNLIQIDCKLSKLEFMPKRDHIFFDMWTKSNPEYLKLGLSWKIKIILISFAFPHSAE